MLIANVSNTWNFMFNMWKLLLNNIFSSLYKYKSTNTKKLEMYFM